MPRSRFLAAIKDLVQVLPARVSERWQGTREISGQRPVVVLVSGFAATTRTLSIMRRRLVRDGYDVVLVPMQWSAWIQGITGFHHQALELQRTFEKIQAQVGDRVPVYLIAHSAGGLVARHYLQFLAVPSRPLTLITLATPHSGSWWTLLGFLTHLSLKARCLFQMLPISPFLKRLNRRAIPQSMILVSIYSKADVLCGRPVGWVGNPAVEIELPDYAHSDFLFRKEAYQVLLSWLRLESSGEIVEKVSGISA